MIGEQRNSCLQMNKNLMKEYLIKGCKQEGTPLYFGVELEHFIVDKETKETVSYLGEKGIEEILKRLMIYYEEKEYSEGHLIALKRKDLSISLEPGAQLEVSLEKQFELEEIAIAYNKFKMEITPILETFGYEMITEGYQPSSKVEEISLLPKKRYEYMNRYFQKIGPYGKQMMRGTASTQVSIDYYSEDDFKKKIWVAYQLEDYFTSFMENTSFYEGTICKEKNIRGKIWKQTDSERVDLIKYMSEEGVSFDDYVEFVMNSPVIVDYKEKQYVYCEERVKTLAQSRIFTEEEISHFFSMVFPMVRAKQFIEIRFADSNPIEKVLQYVAHIKKLFTNVDDTMIEIKEGKFNL